MDSAPFAVKNPRCLMFEDYLQKTLADLETQHRRRRLLVSDLATGPLVRFDNKTRHNFASNDYLGLAAHPQMVAAALEATREFGAGAGASSPAPNLPTANSKKTSPRSKTPLPPSSSAVATPPAPAPCRRSRPRMTSSSWTNFPTPAWSTAPA